MSWTVKATGKFHGMPASLVVADGEVVGGSRATAAVVRGAIAAGAPAGIGGVWAGECGLDDPLQARATLLEVLDQGSVSFDGSTPLPEATPVEGAIY